VDGVFRLHRLVSAASAILLTMRAVNGHSDHDHHGQARQRSDQPGMEEEGFGPTAIITVWIA
jgi:hypothetical protein